MPGALTLTRVAHATTLLDFSGELILTDPWFSEKPGYYHGEPLGVRRQDLPRLTGVASSHGHYDHFDMADFAAYPTRICRSPSRVAWRGPPTRPASTR